MKYRFYLTSILLIFFSSFCFLQSYSGTGTGLIGNPYQISTLADLQQLVATSTDWDKYFVLTNDINCTSSSSFSPIGNNSTAFTGNFNGNGFTISHFTIYSNESIGFAGLFGFVNSGTIRNLNVANSTITSSDEYPSIGALCGGLSHGTIANCSSSQCTITATLSSNYAYVGGLIGAIYRSTIINSMASQPTITGYDCGGFIGFSGEFGVGDNSFSYITNCMALSPVINSPFMSGGFIDMSGSDRFINCSASNVRITNTSTSPYYEGWCGGFCGEANSSTFSLCNSTGQVHIAYSSVYPGFRSLPIGGFIGESSLNTFINSYTQCSLSATGNYDKEMGGFIGHSNQDVVQYSYSEGPISGSGSMTPVIGGFCGHSEDNITAFTCCFWDTNVSSQSNGLGTPPYASTGLTGETTSNMQQAITFTTCGWDFTSVWAISGSGNYPSFIIPLVIPSITQWARIAIIISLLSLGGYFIFRKFYS